MEDRYLFKAKHIHVLPDNNHLDGSWVVGFLSGERYIANDSGEYLIDPSTICRCTGSEDKNGELIYENDIMKNKHNSYRVVWDNEEGSWMLELNSVSLYGLSEVNSKKYEVIGNIFDNPELLRRNEE
jgi:uncharacterized phage protein (TIGR01671 family)